MAGILRVTADGRMKIEPIMADLDETPVTVETVSVCPECHAESRATVTIAKWAAESVRNMRESLCKTCREKERLREIEQYNATQLEYRLKNADIPPEFLEWDREKGNRNLANEIYQMRHKSLYVTGANDKCKTRAAAINLYREIKKGTDCRYWRFPDLAADYARICKTESENAKQWIRRQLEHDIVLIDDVCKRRITETAGELLYDMLDLYYSGYAKCRIWFTANKNLADFANAFTNIDMGDAVASRIDRMADAADGRFKIIQA